MSQNPSIGSLQCIAQRAAYFVSARPLRASDGESGSCIGSHGHCETANTHRDWLLLVHFIDDSPITFLISSGIFCFPGIQNAPFTVNSAFLFHCSLEREPLSKRLDRIFPIFRNGYTFSTPLSFSRRRRFGHLLPIVQRPKAFFCRRIFLLRRRSVSA